jgi:hypothetical protein
MLRPYRYMLNSYSDNVNTNRRGLIISSPVGVLITFVVNGLVARQAVNHAAFFGLVLDPIVEVIRHHQADHCADAEDQ